MRSSAVRLRLGPLPRTDVVKLTITVPILVKEQLDRYAAVHSSTHGEAVDASTLIPYMLNQFMAHDYAFRKATKRGTAAKESGRADE